MADTQMVLVFAYDVERSRTRRKVSNLLEDHAVRVQKSVFEARMTRKQADKLFQKLTYLLDDGDKLRMYALSDTGREWSRSFGGVPMPEENEFWLL